MVEDSTAAPLGAGPAGDRERMRALAAAAVADGTPCAWYEKLYGDVGAGRVPWDHGEPTPFLVEWLQQRFPGNRDRGWAVVVGCAYGDDAELTAEHGFTTTAFDVSGSAIRAAQDRHPRSPVRYLQADLLVLPARLVRIFDLVVECTTLQGIPAQFHQRAAAGIASLCAPGGTIVAIARTPGDDDPPGPPWLLTEREVRQVATGGVEVRRLDRVAMRGGDRWVGEFTRPQVR